MYEKVTKWLPEVAPENCQWSASWAWPRTIEEFREDLRFVACRICGYGYCMEPSEIRMAARDKEFLDTLDGGTIVSAMLEIFAADRICEGVVSTHARAGTFQKFLMRLKELDEGGVVQQPKKEYAFHKRFAEKKKEEEEKRKEMEERKEEENRAREISHVVLPFVIGVFFILILIRAFR